MAGRYDCKRGKPVWKKKVEAVCLIKRCPHLIVNYKIRQSRRVIPMSMVENFGEC